jgi:septum formation protein
MYNRCFALAAMRFILASSSPRRSELLRNAGIAFDVVPAQIPEEPLRGERPQQTAERLALEKAQAVFRRYPDAAVLGADTVVVVDDDLLAKPADDSDAARMLRRLSGRAHEVITGVALLWPGGRDVRSESTQVYFSRLAGDEVAAYIASREPMDKAGAYGIQGLASRWIPRVEGCYFNVVGLPVALVYHMLREAAVLDGR